MCYVKWKGYQSTTFYKGEVSQLVLPLLVSVRGKIFIDLNTKLFVHEYVFQCKLNIVFIFQISKSNKNSGECLKSLELTHRKTRIKA